MYEFYNNYNDRRLLWAKNNEETAVDGLTFTAVDARIALIDALRAQHVPNYIDVKEYVTDPALVFPADSAKATEEEILEKFALDYYTHPLPYPYSSSPLHYHFYAREATEGGNLLLIVDDVLQQVKIFHYGDGKDALPPFPADYDIEVTQVTNATFKKNQLFGLALIAIAVAYGSSPDDLMRTVNDDHVRPFLRAFASHLQMGGAGPNKHSTLGDPMDKKQIAVDVGKVDLITE